jgi:hypothetical protein
MTGLNFKYTTVYVHSIFLPNHMVFTTAKSVVIAPFYVSISHIYCIVVKMAVGSQVFCIFFDHMNAIFTLTPEEFRIIQVILRLNVKHAH